MKLRAILEPLREAVLGTTQYDIPGQPIQLMADFYLLDLLAQPGTRTTRIMHNSGPVPLIDTEIQLCERRLLPYLKQHLLLMLGHSIVCEFRHLIDACDWGAGYLDNALDGEQARGEPGEREYGYDRPPEYAAYYKAQIKHWVRQLGVSQDLWEMLARHTTPENEPGPGDPEPPRPTQDVTKPFIGEAVRLGKQLFLNGSDYTWAEEYGGERWVAACELWEILAQATALKALRLVIDRVYQLQHNTGNILNKNPEYEGQWVTNLLNIKYSMNEPEALMRFATPLVRRLAGFVLAGKYERGWDQQKWGDLQVSPSTPEEIIFQIGKQLSETLSDQFHVSGDGDYCLVAYLPIRQHGIVAEIELQNTWKVPKETTIVCTVRALRGPGMAQRVYNVNEPEVVAQAVRFLELNINDAIQQYRQGPPQANPQTHDPNNPVRQPDPFVPD